MQTVDEIDHHMTHDYSLSTDHIDKGIRAWGLKHVSC